MSQVMSLHVFASEKHQQETAVPFELSRPTSIATNPGSMLTAVFPPSLTVLLICAGQKVQATTKSPFSAILTLSSPYFWWSLLLILMKMYSCSQRLICRHEIIGMVLSREVWQNGYITSCTVCIEFSISFLVLRHGWEKKDGATLKSAPLSFEVPYWPMTCNK